MKKVILYHKFIACSFLFLIVKGFIAIKIFLAQIYCFFLFGFDSQRDHSNQNISGTNLLLAPFLFDSKNSKKCLMLHV